MGPDRYKWDALNPKFDHIKIHIFWYILGMTNCYNNQDCLGANRLCHRNTTMKDGVCTCRAGYKQAIGERIKCLNIGMYGKLMIWSIYWTIKSTV